MKIETAEAIVRYVRNAVIGINRMPTPVQIQTWVKVNEEEDITLEEIEALRIPSEDDIWEMFRTTIKEETEKLNATPPPTDVRDIRGSDSADSPQG